MKEKKITAANLTNVPACTYKNIYHNLGAILSCSFDQRRAQGYAGCPLISPCEHSAAAHHELFKPPD